MKKMLERLITKKYYADKEDIQTKVDVFFGYSRITEDEYADLCELIEQYYPTAEETLTDIVPDENVVTDEGVVTE